MKFAEVETADRRLVLLRGLQGAARYTANTYLLRAYARSVGHVASSDRIETDITWLAEQGLVDKVVREGVTLATLTTRGLDVADGSATVPGVARPQPE
ncbi:MAG: hypothetical protein RL375_2397 [Pseudomonadota bacterium]